MKIIETKGDIFESLVPGDVIAHGANCRGVMGAGIAKAIRSYSKENYESYRKHCLNFAFMPGHILSYRTKDKVRIYNLATQDKPGANAKIEYIDVAVRSMLEQVEYIGYEKVKTVRLGCGIGGLDWETQVKPALEAIDSPVTLEVFYI